MRESTRDCALGIDIGTSGCRASIIDLRHQELVSVSVPLPAPERHGCRSEQAPALWLKRLLTLLGKVTRALDSGLRIRCLAVDGTSASLLLTDRSGKPLTKALMYDDTCAVEQLPLIRASAPIDAPVHGSSSSLAKLLHLYRRLGQREVLAHHQADWLMGSLCGCFGVSDENNCLKLGYDAVRRCWPGWTYALGLPENCLPRVLPPGTPIGTVTPAVAHATGIDTDTWVATGTTDSTAAALAAGLRRPGDALTVLGTTLVLKIVSEHPITEPDLGVYSHRIGDLWLVGGASNTGGGVCLNYFDTHQMRRLTAQLDPARPTGLDYYPLTRPGERFPVNDPDYAPRLTPRPPDDVRFFQGILEGIAAIEQRGYQVLERLGAPRPHRITTIGGGAVNAAWREIRQRCLGIPITLAPHRQAAFGAAILAGRAWSRVREG